MQYQQDQDYITNRDYSKLQLTSKDHSRQLRTEETQLLKKYPPHNYLKQNQSNRIQSIKTKYQTNKIKVPSMPMKKSFVQPLLQNSQTNKLWNVKNVQNCRKMDSQQFKIEEKIKSIKQGIAIQFNKDKENSSQCQFNKYLKTQRFAEFKQQFLGIEENNDDEFPTTQSAAFNINYDKQKITKQRIQDFAREVVKKAQQNFRNQQQDLQEGEEFIHKVNQVNQRISQRFIQLQDKLKQLSYLRKKKKRQQEQQNKRQQQYNLSVKLEEEKRFQEDRRLKQQRKYEEKLKSKMLQLEQEAKLKAMEYEQQQKRRQQEKKFHEQKQKLDKQRKIQQESLEQQIEVKKKQLQQERLQRRKRKQEKLEQQNKKIEQENKKLQQERIRIKRQLEQKNKGNSLKQTYTNNEQELNPRQQQVDTQDIKCSILVKKDMDQTPINNYKLSTNQVSNTNKSQCRKQQQTGSSKISEFKCNKKQNKEILIPQQTSRITQLKGQVKTKEPLPKQFIILINYLRQQILRDRYFTKIVIPISLKKMKAIKQELLKNYTIDLSYLEVLPNQMDPLSAPIDQYSDMSVKVISEAIYNLYRRMQDYYADKLSHKFSKTILQILKEQISMNAGENNNKRLQDINIWTVGHIVSYINMRTGENFRNRDFVKLLRRMDINSMKFQSRNFINALQTNL